MSDLLAGSEVLERLGRQRREVSTALDAANGYVQKHAADHAELAEQHRRAAADLGAALLPRLEPDRLRYAAQLTGYAPLVNEDPLAAREAERAQLRGRLGAIEADPRFAQRELLRHPRTGTLVGKRAELLEHRAPWAEVLSAAQHPRLERLLKVGYGTDAYAVGFWRLSYYQDWQAGDEILARFPTKKAFGEVREELARARETVATFDQELAAIDQELGVGAALEHEHARLEEALRGLDARWLEHARGRVVEHLTTLEPQAVLPRLQADADVHLLYLRVSGLAAKARYLQAMIQQTVGKLQQELPTQLGKIDRDIAKFRRPKNLHAWWPREVIERKVQSRGERYRKQFQRFEAQYHTVYVYDDWSRARGYGDFVWWHVMTDGRVPGQYIPEVAAYEHRHPEWAGHAFHEHAAHEGQASHPGHAAYEAAGDWDDGDAAAAIAEADDDQTRSVDAS